jgi:hypothetical protein
MWSRSRRLGLETVSRPTQGLVSDNLAKVSVSVSVSALRASAQAIISAINKQQQIILQKIERMHNTLAHVVGGPRLHLKIMPIAQVMLPILAYA